MALLRLRRSFCESREMRWQLIKSPMALSFQSVVSTFQTGVETSSFFPRFLAGVGSYSLLSPLARSRENRVCGETDRIHTIIQGDEFTHTLSFPTFKPEPRRTFKTSNPRSPSRPPTVGGRRRHWARGKREKSTIWRPFPPPSLQPHFTTLSLGGRKRERE